MNHSKLAVIAVLSLTMALPAFLWPEEPPPIQNVNPFGGNPEDSMPPGAEFQEDDNFLDPGGNFGFQPNPTPPPPPSNLPSKPSPSAQLPSRNTLPPSTNAPVINPPGTRPSKTATPQPNFGTAQPQTSTTQKKKVTPKLADYLELDPSIKSLEVKNFDLPDKEIKDVVTLISKWTGKNFIIDQKVRGRITIMGPSAVSLQEAYQAFLSALEANGLTTVQSGKYIRIIDSAEARRAPVKTYAGDYAPKDDQFITRIFQLKFINADEVQREFRDLTTRQGKLFAYEPTNSIIITDTGSNIQRIKEILETLDVKNYETTLHVLRIKHTGAKAISDMLGEIYSEGKSSPGQPRSFRKSSLERTRGGGVISKIIPDEQTNSLVVLANYAGFEQLKQLVAKLDVKTTDTGRIHVYYCEYSKAEDLASTLSSLASGGSAKSSKRTSAPPGGAPANAAPIGSAGPVSAELEGGVKVTSDASTNALVITANSSDYQTLKKVIKKLDIPRLQVFVESAIMEVAIDDSTKFGTNFAAAAPGRGFAGGYIGDSGSLLSAVAGGIPSEGATIPFAIGNSFNYTVPSLTGGAGTSVTLSSFMGLINLLTKSTKSSLLSTPQIIALDNEKSEFQVLDETPVVSSSTLLANGGGSTQNIERLKTGITIKLTPHINAASKNIRLEIEQKVDTFKPATTVPKSLQETQVATTSRVTNTSVVVRDQDFIMMGGLMSDKLEETVAKVPLLGDIPILGWLFKSSSERVIKTNTIILMHPKIIGTSLEASNQIQKSLKEREKFVGRHYGSEDPNEKELNEIRGQLNEQNRRGESQKTFEYRNNDDDSSESSPAIEELNKTNESLLDDSSKIPKSKVQSLKSHPTGNAPSNKKTQNESLVPIGQGKEEGLSTLPKEIEDLNVSVESSSEPPLLAPEPSPSEPNTTEKIN